MEQHEAGDLLKRVSEDTACAVGSGVLTLYTSQGEMELTPLRPDYRTLPVYEGLDMNSVYAMLTAMYPGERTFYQMDFQGVIRTDYDESKVAAVDGAALSKARGSADFRIYVTGTPDKYGRTKSTCIWTSREAARAALTNREHEDAVAVGQSLYDEPPVLTHYQVTVTESGEVIYDEMPRIWANHHER